MAYLANFDPDVFVSYSHGGQHGQGGAYRPCAVIDKTGESLPVDVSSFGIERFGVDRESWRGAFRRWLDVTPTRRPAAA
jgi:hypothetical protein